VSRLRANEHPRLDVGASEVTSSSNVIIEDLHSTRNLETTYYVTDVTQASDFYWDRESGLRVNIGIHGVQLIAEYRDVNHAGKDDNLFILDKPVDSDDKNTFREVVHGFCRLVLYCYLLSLLLNCAHKDDIAYLLTHVVNPSILSKKTLMALILWLCFSPNYSINNTNE